LVDDLCNLKKIGWILKGWIYARFLTEIAARFWVTKLTIEIMHSLERKVTRIFIIVYIL